MSSPVVGIDLGTRYALASVWIDGEARLIPNRYGEFRTPSIICLDQKGWHVGEEARRRAFHPVFGCWSDVKRRLGTDWAPVADGRHRSAQEILVPLISTIREDCEAYLHSMVTDCVITVPAQFSFLERSAMARAARAGGFEDVRILNEPTAAAFACESTGRILVFDFGGGTVDVSVVERDGQTWQVLESLGDSSAGGVEIDRALALSMAEKLGITLDQDDPLFRLLLFEAEQVKCALSFQGKLTWQVPIPLASSRSELSFSRSDVEILAAPWLKKAVNLGVTLWKRHSPDCVIMVGGSSRIPLLKTLLAREIPVPVRMGRSPDEAVAIGAAMYGVNGTDRLLLDVLSESLGIIAFDGTPVSILKKGHPLPARSNRAFKSVGGGDLSLSLFQGDPERSSRCRIVAKMDLQDMDIGERVDLDFRIDSGGLLKVHLSRESGESISIAPMELGVSSGDSLDGEDPEALKKRLKRIKPSLSIFQVERAEKLLGKVDMLADLEPHLYRDGLKVAARMIEAIEDEVGR
ncbi:Hsp70 family protein [Dethiosulfovibrio salsuginis]|uniref:Molecular chaperone DnaK n=1 Tax=Dethiosulfovibrio salsuginis TaxID=561720 RepID=A0A1X7J282_9BACT|nr:Hsp70 family protein [Dethiosulfovibrio salsuginis]SMG21668.1 molecular chaperone DnaK [Dethiosulfovibrio salsuginis]